jgi:hypothetical protein
MKCPQCSHTSLFHKRVSHNFFHDVPFLFRKEHVFKCKECGVFFSIPSPYPMIMIIGVGFAPAIILMKDNFAAGSILLGVLFAGFLACTFLTPVFRASRIHFNTTLLENYKNRTCERQANSFELKKIYIGRWQVENCTTA